MSSKLNVESFVTVLKKSGLVETDRLQRLVADYSAQGGSPDDSLALAEFLIANNAVTRWQSEKLLQGKHKGYFLGKYRLLSLLGKGGMSSVYLAEHVLMRRRCALKVLPTKRVHDSSYLARFHREAQAVASLDHPNIVRAYDVDHQSDRDTEIHFLVMEYVEGLSLQEMVQKQGVLPFLDSAEYIRQAALGLQSAHEAGMVHRDVKPGNLLVDPNGVVKVLDLGLARFFTGDEGEDALTIRHDEKVLGTADYLAPEQALDSHNVDSRADIYSLGCTWYFILTGRPPFTEGTLAQRLMAHQSKTPPTVESLRPETPTSLGQIVRKMMSKNPDDRYRTAKEAADTLFTWIDANADPEWRKAHSGIFGSRPSDSAVERSGVPVAKPIVAMPVASIVSPTAPPQVAAQTATATPVTEFPQTQIIHPVLAAAAPALTLPPQFVPHPSMDIHDSTSDVNPELTNFFAAISDSQKVAPPKPAPPPPKPPVVATPKPVAPMPVAPVIAALPVASVPATAVPTAAPVSASDKLELPNFATDNNTESPAFPDFSATTPILAATPPKPKTVTPKPATASSTSVKIALPLKQLSKPILAGIGGGGILLLLLVLYVMGWLGGGGKKSERTAPVAWSPDKREITVGKGGECKTIGEALRLIRQKFEPNGSSDMMVVKIVAGTYRENIVIDGTPAPTRRREKKSDKSVERDWPQGIKLLADGEVILEPGQDIPALRLKNISKLIIEGVEVKVASKKVAIEISGDMNESRLVGMKISGFTEAGIHCAGARGISFGNGQFILDRLTFEPSPDANGAQAIRITGSDDGDSSDTLIRGCRFLGPLAAGMSISGKGPYRLIIAENAFYKTQDGIRFEGAVQWKDNAVLNNTFYECKQGIVFTHFPIDGSRGLSFRRNLFAKTAMEATVQPAYDEGRFAGILAPGGADFNYSDRPIPTTVAQVEFKNLCTQNGKRGDAGITFASTNPTDKNFLAPTEKAVQRNVPGALEGEKNWVGAVGPN